MSIEADDDTLYTLRNLARPAGLWIGVHRNRSVFDSGGPYFVMPRKTHPEERCPTLLKFATPEMVKEFIEQHMAHYAD